MNLCSLEQVGWHGGSGTVVPAFQIPNGGPVLELGWQARWPRQIIALQLRSQFFFLEKRQLQNSITDVICSVDYLCNRPQLQRNYLHYS
jgi:hypothetical protein